MALAMLAAWRDRKGVKHCQKLVTGMRVALGMGTMGAVQIRPDGLEGTRDSLATFCQQCGRCELGRE